MAAIQKKMLKGALKEGAKPKRQRKALCMSLKLEVIKRLERGERNRDICKALRLSSSTVRTIYLNKDKIQKTAESVVDGAKLKTVLKARHPLYEKLESLLLQWIEDQLSRSTMLSYIVIQQKAISLFEDLKKKIIDEGDERVIDMEFKASHGWFERFKKRAYLHNLRLTNDAAPEDIEAVRVFPVELLKIIQAGDYHPKQIFNIDETWLFWKRMMSGTLISQEEKKGTGHMISKDRLTLLLGGNLQGDVKLKPLIVYHSQNPRALKGINRNSLPIFWRSNKKGCMTQQVFCDYVQNYFCPFVEKYCRENSLSNKALLIIDSASGHPTTVIGYGDNVQVVFLPANSSSLLLQPMEQGVISTFKAYYMQLVMKYLVDGLDSNSNLTIKELWKNYNMKIAIENIATAWEKIPEETMNAVWMKLLPEFVHDIKGFESVEKTIKEDIVKLAYRAGFEQVHTEDVQEVLDSHTEELTNEELIQRDTGGLDEDDEQEDELPKEMSIHALRQYFSLIDRANVFLDENDGNLERVRQVKTRISETIQCYRDLYERKVRDATQTSIFSLFRPVASSALEPQPSTSGILKCCKKVEEEEENIMDSSLMEYEEVTVGASSPLPSFIRLPTSCNIQLTHAEKLNYWLPTSSCSLHTAPCCRWHLAKPSKDQQ